MNIQHLLKALLVGTMTFASLLCSPGYAASSAEGNTLIISSPLGKVKGVINDDIAAFYGVPYAANPFVEGRRFQAPQRIKAWNGVLDATMHRDPVPQPGRTAATELVGAPGDLTVNIWTPASAVTHGAKKLSAQPKQTPAKKLPVMVWIPGGAFIREDASEAVYNGQSFAKNGAIVVTVNYRVGVDGFMHLKGAPDNRGILDQILALQWVKDNIATYGGDPQQVTLFGQSAGAESVAILLGTPQAKGLFHQAIIQSPPMQSVTLDEARHIASAFAKTLNISPTMKDMASVPYATLVKSVIEVGHAIQNNRDEWGKLSLGGTAFLPVVDHVLLSNTPMMNLVHHADPSIPVIVGSTDQEARLYLTPGGQLDRIQAKQVSVLLEDLHLQGTPATVYGHKEKTPGDIYADIQSDYTFRMPALQIAEHLVNNGNTVWHYNFSWHSPAFGGKLGAAHFVDVPFTFNTTHTAQAQAILGDEPPKSLVDTMHHQWGDFAKTGKVSWTPYLLDDRETMRFDTHSEEVSDPENDVRMLWNDYRF